MPNIYISRGYADRNEYLESLADEYDVDMQIVSAAAGALGPNEDFDGLVTTLEDYAR
jgi:hypothetical protein